MIEIVKCSNCGLELPLNQIVAPDDREEVRCPVCENLISQQERPASGRIAYCKCEKFIPDPASISPRCCICELPAPPANGRKGNYDPRTN